MIVINSVAGFGYTFTVGAAMVAVASAVTLVHPLTVTARERVVVPQALLAVKFTVAAPALSQSTV